MDIPLRYMQLAAALLAVLGSILLLDYPGSTLLLLAACLCCLSLLGTQNGMINRTRETCAQQIDWYLTRIPIPNSTSRRFLLFQCALLHVNKDAF